MSKIKTKANEIREANGFGAGWLKGRASSLHARNEKYRLYYELMQEGIPAATIGHYLGVHHTSVMYGVTTYAKNNNLPSPSAFNLEGHQKTARKNAVRSNEKRKAQRKLARELKEIRIEAERKKHQAEMEAKLVN